MHAGNPDFSAAYWLHCYSLCALQRFSDLPQRPKQAQTLPQRTFPSSKQQQAQRGNFL
jgi:hypothetical protein